MKLAFISYSLLCPYAAFAVLIISDEFIVQYLPAGKAYITIIMAFRVANRYQALLAKCCKAVTAVGINQILIKASCRHIERVTTVASALLSSLLGMYVVSADAEATEVMLFGMVLAYPMALIPAYALRACGRNDLLHRAIDISLELAVRLDHAFRVRGI